MRLTIFAPGPTGARRIGVTVRGIHVLVEPDDSEQQEAAEALASSIAALGPEMPPAPAAIPVSTPCAASPDPVRRDPPFEVGERIYCTVHGAEGFCTVLEVGAGRRRGYIRISGEGRWCPAHNFARQPPVQP